MDSIRPRVMHALRQAPRPIGAREIARIIGETAERVGGSMHVLMRYGYIERVGVDRPKPWRNRVAKYRINPKEAAYR